MRLPWQKETISRELFNELKQTCINKCAELWIEGYAEAMCEPHNWRVSPYSSAFSGRPDIEDCRRHARRQFAAKQAALKESL